MPYVTRWEAAPNDMNIILLKEKPSNTNDAGFILDSNGKVQYSRSGQPSRYHYCQYCKGWIMGEPNRYKENTLAPLAGRKGTVEHCIRCGGEINFFGMRS